MINHLTSLWCLTCQLVLYRYHTSNFEVQSQKFVLLCCQLTGWPSSVGCSMTWLINIWNNWATLKYMESMARENAHKKSLIFTGAEKFLCIIKSWLFKFLVSLYKSGDMRTSNLNPILIKISINLFRSNLIY